MVKLLLLLFLVRVPGYCIDQYEPRPLHDSVYSLGTLRVTAYCGCSECCGVKSRPLDEDGREIVKGAAGIRLEQGLSCAATADIPLGTKLRINGCEYTVQDRPASWIYEKYGTCVDIYFDDHEAAWDFGLQYLEVESFG